MAPPPPTGASRFGNPVLAAAISLVAFGVRGAWLVGVQRPGDAVYSDMKGYIERARAVLAGSDSEVCFAPGTHWLYAAELAVFGPDGLDAMGWVQAGIGALVAPVTFLLAVRCLGNVVAAAIVGLVVASWYPLVTYTGYFSSEAPYTLALVTSVWAWVRYVQEGRGAVLAGVATGLAYLVRPPILLAVPLLVAWALARGAGTRRGLAAFLVPVVCAVALGAARYHDRTGRLGLIADNGAVMSLFAFTDYGGLEATPPPGVSVTQTGFHPPARRKKNGFAPDFRFEGLRCDPGPLVAERNRAIASASWTDLARRLGRNVRFLYRDNHMWPERGNAVDGARGWLLHAWPPLVRQGLLPLAAVGLVATALAAWRAPPGKAARAELDGRAALVVHVGAMVLTALAYTGEVRYRVPYDPLLLTLAAIGPLWLARRFGAGRAGR